ncbi:MAG: thioredoxin family protein [candidate division KSB1 bacterium]|jgi:thioredoxin-related protein|nr:thioredoxin family protein [candidate division KSB1 bacterium]
MNHKTGPALIVLIILTGAMILGAGCSEEESALPKWYDPLRDPGSDLQVAVELAQQAEKRVLMVVGGDWCKWCHFLRDFWNLHSDINGYLHDHYVLLKVNFSPDNKNEVFLSKYPEIRSYPHINILDANGALLHSQDTAVLESGQSYDPVIMKDFLRKWSGRE